MDPVGIGNEDLAPVVDPAASVSAVGRGVVKAEPALVIPHLGMVEREVNLGEVVQSAERTRILQRVFGDLDTFAPDNAEDIGAHIAVAKRQRL
ncbi:MAG: hypothetical protein ACOYOU_19715, partial [Kiritimatiellia bacterium]